MDHLRNEFPRLAEWILHNPSKAIPMFEDRLNSIVKQEFGGDQEKQRAQGFPTQQKTFRINFTGNMGKQHVTPRGLKANLLNKMVNVQGIVTRVSIVKPKLQTSYHYSDQSGNGLVRNYHDQYAIA
jgi:DNA replication licensing factor MCM3